MVFPGSKKCSPYSIMPASMPPSSELVSGVDTLEDVTGQRVLSLLHPRHNWRGKNICKQLLGYSLKKHNVQDLSVKTFFIQFYSINFSHLSYLFCCIFLSSVSCEVRPIPADPMYPQVGNILKFNVQQQTNFLFILMSRCHFHFYCLFLTTFLTSSSPRKI